MENTLEKEQESLVNRLWKRMEKLETDKKLLQLKIQQPHSYNAVRIMKFHGGGNFYLNKIILLL